MRNWDPFHKALFQWQMTKISDKSADNQSEARISVAYNKNCHLSLMTSFVKWGPELQIGRAFNNRKTRKDVSIMKRPISPYQVTCTSQVMHVQHILQQRLHWGKLQVHCVFFYIDSWIQDDHFLVGYHNLQYRPIGFVCLFVTWLLREYVYACI